MSYNTELEVLPLKRVESDLSDALLNSFHDESNDNDEEALERSIRDMKLLASALQPFEIEKTAHGLQISIHKDDPILLDVAGTSTLYDMKKYIIIGSCVLGGVALGGPLGGIIAGKIAFGAAALVGGALGGTVGSKISKAT